ncbi:TIM barrel protein [Methanolobus sp.]|uniref:TIM barrel protein n=1 Tax=Methanolobus sp. TaxID=1874737 RepID=UPI0025CC9623|nr:TIM barrel protein [Methanolobus sp.]
MKELINLSTYKIEMDMFDSDWGTVESFLDRHQLDGIELYVDQSPLPDGIPDRLIQGVHLPYWMGRHRAWLDNDAFSCEMDESEKIYLFGGLSRGEVIGNFRRAMENAHFLDAAYGVFHVTYVELEHVFTRSFNCTDREVMDTTAAFLNESVSSFPNGEPPVRLFFENLWWPGLTFLDPGAISYFTEQLDFDNWAFVLDVGHLMAATMDCNKEGDAVDTVLEVLSKHSDDIVDHIEGMHFHCNLSGEYMRACLDMDIPENFDKMPFYDRLGKVMQVVERMDRHMPFTDERCSEIVDYVSPDYLTHEFILHDLQSTEHKLRTQRDALNNGMRRISKT